MVPFGGADPSPVIRFTQVGRMVGIDRANEPASAGPFNPDATLAYGTWLADFDGDGRLDYFGMNHGQVPHSSGLFMNNGAGGFGKNLFTVSFQPSPESYPNLNLTNEVRFVGDLNGDGLVDFHFTSWSGLGGACINQGVGQHGDWTGPGYICYGTTDGLAFADVNGDGMIDVLALDGSPFDPYTAYYSQTAPYVWRLNNGSPNVASWPATRDFLSLRVIDRTAVAAPFVDLNNDGIPDKIVGLPAADTGPYATAVAGHQVFLGQANGTYAMVPAAGLESATEPITRVEDINDDGCIDVGTDLTAYRDNQSWYIQKKSGDACTATFVATPRTALPFFPGFKHYAVDIDNSGRLSQAVIVHITYSHGDGLPGGVSIYHKQPDGGYRALTPAQLGININGTADTEFYADNLSPGDWNDDGRVDLGGSGEATIAGTDAGFALWTSNLATTNSWIKLTVPTVTGFFTGAATIEVFDAGGVGDPAHLVTPPKVLYTGRAWATQVYHFGIGTRPSVDVRVTFPDGRQSIRKGIAAATRISITR
ncbi:MAG TPA: VCBS repeat-containing protein [Kofleriaceae bacterium]